MITSSASSRYLQLKWVYNGQPDPTKELSGQLNRNHTKETLEDLHSRISLASSNLRGSLKGLYGMDFFMTPEMYLPPVAQIEQHISHRMTHQVSLPPSFPREEMEFLQRLCREPIKDEVELEKALGVASLFHICPSLYHMRAGFLGERSAATGVLPLNSAQRLELRIEQIKLWLIVAMRTREYLQETNVPLTNSSFWAKIINEYKANLEDISAGRRTWDSDYPQTPSRPMSMLYGLSQEVSGFREIVGPDTITSYLSALYVGLHREPVSPCVVVSGAGGMGKSTLAAAYAREAAQHRAYDLIAWLNAESEETLRESYIDLLEDCDVSVPDDKRHDWKYILRKIRNSTQFKTKTSPLFIFDNAESYEKVKEWLPNTGHQIITTREQTRDVSCLNLQEWGEEESLNYLLDRCGVHQKLRDVLDSPSLPIDNRTFIITKLKELVRILEGHPLALSLIPYHFEESYQSYSQYLSKVENLLSQIKDYKPRTSKYNRSLSLLACIDLSVKALSVDEQPLFDALLYLSPDRIVCTMMADFVGPEKEIMSLWESLGRKSLVSLQGLGDQPVHSARIHRVIQEIGRHLFEESLGSDPSTKQAQLRSHLERIQDSLNEWRLRYAGELARRPNPDRLPQMNDDLANAATHWKQLVAMAQAKGVLLPDSKANIIKSLRAAVVDKIIETATSSDQDNASLARHLKIEPDKFELLKPLCDAYLGRFTSPVERRILLNLLSKVKDEHRPLLPRLDLILREAPFEDLKEILSGLVYHPAITAEWLERCNSLYQEVHAKPVHCLMATEDGLTAAPTVSPQELLGLFDVLDDGNLHYHRWWDQGIKNWYMDLQPDRRAFVGAFKRFFAGPKERDELSKQPLEILQQYRKDVERIIGRELNSARETSMWICDVWNYLKVLSTLRQREVALLQPHFATLGKSPDAVQILGMLWGKSRLLQAIGPLSQDTAPQSVLRAIMAAGDLQRLADPTQLDDQMRQMLPQLSDWQNSGMIQPIDLPYIRSAMLSLINTERLDLREVESNFIHVNLRSDIDGRTLNASLLVLSMKTAPHIYRCSDGSVILEIFQNFGLSNMSNADDAILVRWIAERYNTGMQDMSDPAWAQCTKIARFLVGHKAPMMHVVSALDQLLGIQDADALLQKAEDIELATSPKEEIPHGLVHVSRLSPDRLQTIKICRRGMDMSQAHFALIGALMEEARWQRFIENFPNVVDYIKFLVDEENIGKLYAPMPPYLVEFSNL